MAVVMGAGGGGGHFTLLGGGGGGVDTNRKNNRPKTKNYWNFKELLGQKHLFKLYNVYKIDHNT